MTCAACALANASAICVPIFRDVHERHAAARDQLVERATVNQLHHHVGDITLGAEVVDGDDVGVLERGNGAGFVQEPSLAILVRHDLGPQHLDATSRRSRGSWAR